EDGEEDVEISSDHCIVSMMRSLINKFCIYYVENVSLFLT
ncbi:MAG: hypothetical protein ACI90V_003202, partial [Bacillariaceae sp.]